MCRVFCLLMCFSGCCSLAMGQTVFVVEPPPAPAAADASDFYVAVFTAENCSPCLRIERETVRDLKAAGVPVTVVNMTRENVPASWGVSVTPSIWVVDKKTKRPRAKFSRGEFVSAFAVLDAARLSRANAAAPDPPEVRELPASSSSGPAAAEAGFWDGKPGSSYESREAMILHLLEGSTHRGRHTRAELELLSDRELGALHEEDHSILRAAGLITPLNSSSGRIVYRTAPRRRVRWFRW